MSSKNIHEYGMNRAGCFTFHFNYSKIFELYKKNILSSNDKELILSVNIIE